MSRKEEILEVKKLGERIGYGNLMDIASALMSIKSCIYCFTLYQKGRKSGYYAAGASKSRRN